MGRPQQARQLGQVPVGALQLAAVCCRGGLLHVPSPVGVSRGEEHGHTSRIPAAEEGVSEPCKRGERDFASFEDFFKCRWFLRLGLFVNLTLTSELEVIMKFLIFPAPVIEFSAKFPDLNQLLASNPSKYFLKNTKSFLLTQLPLHRHNVFPASCWTCVTKQTRPMPWASSSGGTPGGANWPASSWPTSPTTSSSLRPRAPRRPSSSTGGEAWRRHPILLLLSRTSFPYLYFGRNSSSECLVWFTLMIEGDK